MCVKAISNPSLYYKHAFICQQKLMNQSGRNLTIDGIRNKVFLRNPKQSLNPQETEMKYVYVQQHSEKYQTAFTHTYIILSRTALRYLKFFNICNSYVVTGTTHPTFYKIYPLGLISSIKGVTVNKAREKFTWNYK